jgi:hypothetical protein
VYWRGSCRLAERDTIIGGLIGFVLKSVGWVNIDYDTFTLFAIHFFTLNFISIGLTGTEDAVVPEGSSIPWLPVADYR